MERVHPKDDLLQRTAGDEADEERIVRLQRFSIDLEPGVRREPGDQLRDVKKRGLDTAPGQCVLQGLRVPAPSMSDDADPSILLGASLQSNNTLRIISPFTAPAWNVRPLVTLLTKISAGLKSSGSIL